jgi:hypothetical protein
MIFSEKLKGKAIHRIFWGISPGGGLTILVIIGGVINMFRMSSTAPLFGVIGVTGTLF